MTDQASDQAIPKDIIDFFQMSQFSQQPRPGPLVIGAGLMRTGTSSQKRALEMLLGGRCYHMEVIMLQKRSHLKLWYKAATEGLTKQLADEIFNGEYRSCTDYPAAHFYQELSEIYPNAKFVLSVRDQKRWVESVRATIQPLASAFTGFLSPVRWILGISYYLPLINAILGPRLGMRFDMSDAEMIRAFDRHTESVIRAIPKERLLVFRVADGWGPLCAFLDVPVPDAPFPNVNDTQDFQRNTRIFRLLGVALNVVMVGVAAAAVVWSAARLAPSLLLWR